MGFPLAPYFLCLHYFGPTVAPSCFSTYCPWVCFFSISGPIQPCLPPQDPLYEPVSHSFLPLELNGFFLLANFGLPMLLGLFSYWACEKWASTDVSRKEELERHCPPLEKRLFYLIPHQKIIRYQYDGQQARIFCGGAMWIIHDLLKSKEDKIRYMRSIHSGGSQVVVVPISNTKPLSLFKGTRVNLFCNFFN